MKNKQFDNKTILCTGGTGSWGSELTRQLLLYNPKEIKIYSRNEANQVKFYRKFNDKRLKMIIGDVQDFGGLKYACKKVDYVFHLACLKHVPICESQPYETIKININGTRNVIRACIENNVKIMVDVSSDKACLPINSYGLSKALGEKLTLNGTKLESNTKFMVIRGGNVLATAGSVVPFWINQIKKYNKISITDKKMTRYFLTLPEAIKLLFVAMESDINGGLFVMKMPACKIIDLAEVMIKHYGNKDTKIEEIGIRPGEKLDEILISEHESLNTYEYGDNYYFIANKLPSKMLNLKKVIFQQYTSYQYLMNKQEIRKLLIKGGYLK